MAQDRERRPPVPDVVGHYVRYWWQQTAETPEFRDTRLQVLADNHDLFPYDRRRRTRNQQKGDLAGLRSRADARVVQNPHLFRAAQRCQAMTLPDGHGFEFKPKAAIPSESQQEPPLGSTQQDSQFAATLTRVLQASLDEIGWSSISEDWVLKGCCHRNSVLKFWWQSDYLTDPLGGARLSDMQDELAELESLWSDYREGRFGADDGRFQRLLEMQLAVQQQTQVKVWRGFCAEVVRLDSFRLDPRVKSIDNFYSAKWMSEDLVMTKRDIMARFPYLVDDKPDKNNPKGFWGVHPDDLGGGAEASDDDGASQILDAEETRRDGSRSMSASGGSDSNFDSLDDDDDLFLVRQIFIRDEGKVLVLIDGVEYPAAEWRPKNTHANWYPFFPLCFNRSIDSWYGRSDTELASDEQARLNQKMTDIEKLRELAIPRGVVNGEAVDDTEVFKLNQLSGGEFRTIRVPGSTLAQNLMWLTFNYPSQLEDLSNNFRMLDKMVGFSEAFMGNMGGQGVNFATEVAVMAQGANIMISQRQAVVHRALKLVYIAAAEILIQVYSLDDVRLITDERAFWPEIYGQKVAVELKQQLTRAAILQVMTELAAVQQDQNPLLKAAEFPGIENPQQRAKTLYEQMAKAEWGMLEPLTREVLFQRLHLVVRTSPNARLDRQQKLNSVVQFSQSLQSFGVRLAPRAAARILGELLEQEENVDDLLVIDPNVAVADVVQGVNNSLDDLTPQSLSSLAAAGKVAEQKLLQVAQAAGEQQAREMAAQAEAAGDQADLAARIAGGGGQGAGAPRAGTGRGAPGQGPPPGQLPVGPT